MRTKRYELYDSGMGYIDTYATKREAVEARRQLVADVNNFAEYPEKVSTWPIVMVAE